jgi:hypothetical protein
MLGMRDGFEPWYKMSVMERKHTDYRDDKEHISSYGNCILAK